MTTELISSPNLFLCSQEPTGDPSSSFPAGRLYFRRRASSGGPQVDSSWVEHPATLQGSPRPSTPAIPLPNAVAMEDFAAPPMVLGAGLPRLLPSTNDGCGPTAASHHPAASDHPWPRLHRPRDHLGTMVPFRPPPDTVNLPAAGGKPWPSRLVYARDEFISMIDAQGLLWRSPKSVKDRISSCILPSLTVQPHVQSGENLAN